MHHIVWIFFLTLNDNSHNYFDKNSTFSRYSGRSDIKQKKKQTSLQTWRLGRQGLRKKLTIGAILYSSFILS